MNALSTPETIESLDIHEITDPLTPWNTIVWNDPVNLMSYVTYVFQSYFGFTEGEAERRMLLVHNEGRAVVATGSREEMERHAEAMHDFGLWATVSKANE
jgi:ATP-dependent Clp protease adaptor protein ClpS